MQPKRKGRMRTLSALTVMMMFVLTGCGKQYIVLNPAGPVGKQELNLIILSVVLTMVVIVPVLLLLVYIVWRYRDKPGNKAPYRPYWAESRKLEIIWWGIPILIVGVLGYFTGKTTFTLMSPPENNVKPVTIQVTSLDWKWLFQYPGQQVATVNYCEIPTGVPVQFVLTSDAPMNSFWVPQLGGQEYTMPGMSMGLWLQADKAGTYYGHGANFTGKGFADMDFHVIAVSDSKFNAWVNGVKSSSPSLTMAGYQKLKQPSVVGTSSYSSFPPGLFNSTVWADGGRYMSGMPGMQSGAVSSKQNTSNMTGMSNMTGTSSTSQSK